MPRYRLFARQDTTPPPGDEFARREALTVGTYKPDATNTGLITDTSALTVHEGNFTASAAGQQVRDLEIRGKLIVTGTNVTVDNCWIRGPATRPTGANEGLVECNNRDLNLMIRDCYLDPRAPGSSLDGVRTRGFTAKRLRIRRVTDGFNISPGAAGTRANIQILGCWVFGHTKFYPDTDVPGGHTDGTHNDPIQLQGGVGSGNIIVRGNRLEGYFDPDTGNTGGLNTGDGGTLHSPASNHCNAVIQMNRNQGELTDILVEQNWIYGGRIAVNGTSISTAVNLGIIRNNWFDHGQYLDVSQQGSNNTQTVRIHPTCTVDTSGNAYEDNGVAVNVRRAT